MARRRRYGSRYTSTDTPTYTPPAPEAPEAPEAPQGPGRHPARYTPPVRRATTHPDPVHVTPRDWMALLAEAEAGLPGSHIDRSFCGVNTYQEALTLARHGWPEGMAAVRTISLPLVRAVVSDRTLTGGWAWDVTGAAYDVGEYLSGAPECWLTPETETAKPAVKIGFNLTSAAGVDQRTLMARGAAVVALVLALQTAGYVVEVTAAIGYAPDYQRSGWLMVPCTDTEGGPLDTDRLLFALAHPAMPRALGFAILDKHILGGRHATWGGWAQTPPPGEYDCWIGEIGLNRTNWQSPEAQRAWVEAQFTQLTGGN
jgi:hypothetical protein